MKKIRTVLGHSSAVMTMDLDGHLLTMAEEDVEIFEKLEQDPWRRE